ncbi:MAG: tetratricopeptide repeat protein [Lewinellaceae bacterium]|nr:tetratricopeptide repeat protein [Phaeodactylibacter sp.]MCB9040244.1 tetratricopeptide repeat protein [Lewinellaceae bacterium]
MKHLLALGLLLCLGLPGAHAQQTDSVQLLLDAAWNAYDLQEYEKMKDLAGQALHLAKKQGQEAQQANSCRAIAIAEESQSHFDEAYRYYRLALSIWEQRNDRENIARVSQDIAILKDMEGDYELARNAGQRAVKAFEELGDTLGLANALVDLANANKSLGDLNIALKNFQRADTLFRWIQDTMGTAISGYGIGDIQYRQGRYDLARPSIAAVIPIFEREEEYEKLAMAYNVLASIDEGEGRRADAKENYRNSITWAEQAGDSLALFDASLNLAVMEAGDRNLEQSRALLSNARHALGGEGNVLDEASLDKVAANLDALERQMENERLLRWLLLAGFFLSAAAIFAFWQYRKRKANALLLKEQTIEHQQKVNSLLDDIQLSIESARMEGAKRERKKITKTLHDTVGSQLAATRWLQEANIEALKSGALNQEAMQNVLEMMSEAYKNARNVERLLDKDSIDWLEEVGIFFQALTERSQLVIEYIVNGLEDKLDWELALSVYKIVLTLTANVLLHAKASHLKVQVRQAEGALGIAVEDDGVGFDRNNLQYGNGLKNVEEYVEQHGGTMSIKPQPGKGTVIAINIPEGGH